MRTLSAALTAKQKTLTYDPLYKVVLSRTSQTTRGYDLTRILAITHTEDTDGGQAADISLHNADGALTAINFEHYQAVISYGMKTGVVRSAWVANTAYALDDFVRPITANGYQYRCSVAGTSHATTEPTWPTGLGVTVTDNTVTWEMDGATGDEYSYSAPLRVRAQTFQSGVGLLRCELTCVGIFSQMAEDKAKIEYTPGQAEIEGGIATGPTVQTLITAIAGVSSPLSDVFSGYTAYTVTYDSTDSIIGVFAPGNLFRIDINDNRLKKIQELLDFTGCKMRVNNDGKIHVFDPVVSGAVYDYTYEFNVANSHTFLNKSLRNRFVEPNEEVVKSHPEEGMVSGSATSATSYALAPKTRTTYLNVASDAEAALIAAALIEQTELNAEKGFGIVTMNCGQEVWDYVNIIDSRQNDSVQGNIQFLQRNIKIPLGRNEAMTFNMMIGFGKGTTDSILGNLLASQGIDAEGKTVTLSQLLDILKKLTTDVNELTDRYSVMRAFLIEQGDYAIFKKLWVTEQLRIPVHYTP